MDDDGLNIHNWGYYEPSPKGHLGFHLMTSMPNRDLKPFLPSRDNPVMVNANGAFHHHRECVVSEPPAHVDYLRDIGISPRERYLQMLPGNPTFSFLAEPSGTHPVQNLQLPNSSKDPRVGVEDPSVRKEGGGPMKKRNGGATPKAPKAKKTKKGPSVPKENGNSSGLRAKPAKKNIDVVINGIDMDISGIPIPVCSCTGSPQQCYRWGCGGWQSACCTTTISMYPLPMSTKRRGARIAGRKMSQGAFKKVLEKLASEGYNFGSPIDLRNHWAKHGTNKFVTIR